MKEFDECGSSQPFEPPDDQPELGTGCADHPFELPDDHPPALYAVESPPFDQSDFKAKKPDSAIDINDATIAFLARRPIAKNAIVAKRPTFAFAARRSGPSVFINFFFPRPV